MVVTDQRETIVDALAGFDSRPLAEAAIALFKTLGYASERRLALQPNTVATFLSTFDQGHSLPADAALRIMPPIGGQMPPRKPWRHFAASQPSTHPPP